MSPLVIMVVLVSSLPHVAWNLLSKRSSRTTGFFLLANCAVVVFTCPLFFLLGGWEVAKAPSAFWLFVVLTGVFQAGYFICLMNAYRYGDLSLAYPLSRTTPVFVAIIEGLSAGRWPSPMAAAGIGVVVAGCLMLPWRRFGIGPGGLDLKSYANRGSLWALGTAVVATGYTLADAAAMELIQPVQPGLRGAIVYGWLEWLSVVVFLLMAIAATGGAGRVGLVWREERSSAAAVGLLMYLAYLPILWAYNQAENVAYVVSFRHFTVVLGVIAAVVILKEKGGRVRLVASCVIVAGLVLVGQGGR